MLVRLLNLRACALLLSPISVLRGCYYLVLLFQFLRYYLRFKNPRKSTGPDFISLKVIEFALNVIDSHLYTIITKDLEKNKYSKQPKADW